VDHVAMLLEKSMKIIEEPSNKAKLSPQQQIIMQYLVNGFTPKEISQKMGITSMTVGKYITRVRLKIGAKSVYHCIAVLMKLGMVDVDPESPCGLEGQ
jgi:DNA-binding CsgD family transcriptional regulator